MTEQGVGEITESAATERKSWRAMIAFVLRGRGKNRRTTEIFTN